MKTQRGTIVFSFAMLLLAFAGYLGNPDASRILKTYLEQTLEVAYSANDTFARESTATVTGVHDGDTITLDTGERVRYIGIDTPELSRDGNPPECYANEARERNHILVFGKTVRLVADKENQDKYGRLLRFVYVDGILVNETLIREGYATRVYFAPNDGHQEEFKDAEQDAKNFLRGRWEHVKQTDNE